MKFQPLVFSLMLSLPGLLSGCAEPTAEANAALVKTAAPASIAPSAFDAMPAVGTKAFCPVMKNEFTVNAGTQFSVFEGKTYVFCCPGCKPQFDGNPAAYAKK